MNPRGWLDTTPVVPSTTVASTIRASPSVLRFSTMSWNYKELDQRDEIAALKEQLSVQGMDNSARHSLRRSNYIFRHSYTMCSVRGQNLQV